MVPNHVCTGTRRQTESTQVSGQHLCGMRHQRHASSLLCHVLFSMAVPIGMSKRAAGHKTIFHLEIRLQLCTLDNRPSVAKRSHMPPSPWMGAGLSPRTQASPATRSWYTHDRVVDWQITHWVEGTSVSLLRPRRSNAFPKRKLLRMVDRHARRCSIPQYHLLIHHPVRAAL